jgi:hypothetical protein
MNFATDSIERLITLGSGLLCGAVLLAQPLCEVLLRPAFHYTTSGLTVVVADSSSTFGLEADATWSFGDGSALSSVPYHQYEVPGTYEVCITLTGTTLPCTATYCRQVIVPLDDCSGTMDAYFEWGPGGTNSADLYDASFNQNISTRLWEFDDGGSSSEGSPNYTWQLPGAHFVSLTRSGMGCTATYARWVSVDGNASTCGPDLFVNFYAYPVGLDVGFEPSIVATNAIPVISIWSFGDGMVDTTSSAFHSYSEPGSYQTCLLVGALRTPSLDSCFAIVCNTTDLGFSTSLADEVVSNVLVWPNPFDDLLHVALSHPAGSATIQVHDAVGRSVSSGSISGTEQIALDMDHLDAGTYHIVVQAEGVRWRASVIKAH